MAKNEEEKDEWLTTKCFKLAADGDAPAGLRILGPFLGVGIAVTEPIARFCFWLHEREEAREEHQPARATRWAHRRFGSARHAR